MPNSTSLRSLNARLHPNVLDSTRPLRPSSRSRSRSSALPLPDLSTVRVAHEYVVPHARRAGAQRSLLVVADRRIPIERRSDTGLGGSFRSPAAARFGLGRRGSRCSGDVGRTGWRRRRRVGGVELLLLPLELGDALFDGFGRGAFVLGVRCLARVSAWKRGGAGWETYRRIGLPGLAGRRFWCRGGAIGEGAVFADGWGSVCGPRVVVWGAGGERERICVPCGRFRRSKSVRSEERWDWLAIEATEEMG